MSVYYVRPTNGNDASAGTSFAAAWKTTQHALDTVTAGNEIRLCAEAIETTLVAIDIDTNLGLSNSPIDIYGASATDGSRLDGAGVYTLSGGLGALITCSINTHMRIRDVRFTGAGSDNWQVSGAAFLDFLRCSFDGATQHGFYSSNTTGVQRFVDCDVYGNGGDGLSAQAATGRGRFRVVACRVHGNGGDGVFALGNLGSVLIARTVLYANGAHGISLQQSYYADVIGCTAWGNSGNGIDLASSSLNGISIVDTSLALNGGYGLDTNATTYALGTIDGLHFHNNTSGDCDVTYPGLVIAHGDPLFRDPAAGDFAPSQHSPLLGAGVNGADIGAISRPRFKRFRPRVPGCVPD